MTRLRVVSYIVQPQVMADDGENLTPLQVNPVAIPASEWQEVLATVAAGIEHLRGQVEAEPGSLVPDEPVSA